MHQTLVGTLWERVRRLGRTGDRGRTARGSNVAGADPAGSTQLRADGGEQPEAEPDDHLRDIPDGAGCTEIWEHLSEREPPGTEAVADD